MPEDYNAVPFERVYVATDKDDADTLNEMVNHVNYLLLQPGIYNLDRPLVLKRDNMVILGIGMPTLRSTNGNSVIQVMQKKGVRLAGFILEAASETDNLL